MLPEIFIWIYNIKISTSLKNAQGLNRSKSIIFGVDSIPSFSVTNHNSLLQINMIIFPIDTLVDIIYFSVLKQASTAIFILIYIYLLWKTHYMMLKACKTSGCFCFLKKYKSYKESFANALFLTFVSVIFINASPRLFKDCLYIFMVYNMKWVQN